MLSWVPVWGGSVYHVTVVSGAFTQSFDVTGTSLTLPKTLPNGDFTWTVTPASGTASAPGSFSLLIPPSLSISGTDANGNTNVTWPISAPGYQLQFNSGLDQANWVLVSGKGFFRLVKP